ncbi:MAG: L-seryl-tRNA(Sec) selenium transferase [Acidimicrobiales bacterium]
MRSGGPAQRPPSVDALARSLADLGLPHPLLVEASRAAIEDQAPETARIRAELMATRLLQPVLNATGVLLHTNLGRAPLEHTTDGRQTNLELDLASGGRGSRQSRVSGLLTTLTGAEDVLVVNNGAAAVLLVLTALSAGRGVVVSRGELVEIGGGFRIPEILAASGARLVEVGTTNRTRLSDYKVALEAGPEIGLVLKVHQSNYRIVGFSESVAICDLAKLGRSVVADLGSGLLDATTPWLGSSPPPWLAGEPAVRQSLVAGADLVTFSGDKLLGGPQAGIIAGRRELVTACARHPLARALRPGGLVISSLQETALAYLRRDTTAIPFWRMAMAPVEQLRARAAAIAAKSGDRARVVECLSVAGGGSLPGLEIPSAGLALEGDRAALLRSNDPPVIARVKEGFTLCDLRSIDARDDLVLADALARVAASSLPL